MSAALRLAPQWTVKQADVESLPLGDCVLDCCIPEKLLGSGSNGAVVQVKLDLESLRMQELSDDLLDALFPGLSRRLIFGSGNARSHKASESAVSMQAQAAANSTQQERVLALKVSSHYWSEGALQLLACEDRALRALAPGPCQHSVRCLSTFRASVHSVSAPEVAASASSPETAAQGQQSGDARRSAEQDEQKEEGTGTATDSDSDGEWSPPSLARALEHLPVSMKEEIESRATPRAFTVCYLLELLPAAIEDVRAAYPAPAPYHLLWRWTRDLLRMDAEHAAAGVLHCDVKADNVMVAVDGVLKGVDFGISTVGPPVALPAREQEGGTPSRVLQIDWAGPDGGARDSSSGTGEHRPSHDSTRVLSLSMSESDPGEFPVLVSELITAPEILRQHAVAQGLWRQSGEGEGEGAAAAAAAGTEDVLVDPRVDYSLQSEWSVGMLSYELGALLSPYPRWPRRMLGDGTGPAFHAGPGNSVGPRNSVGPGNSVGESGNSPEEHWQPLRLPAPGGPAAAAPQFAEVLRGLVEPDPSLRLRAADALQVLERCPEGVRPMSGCVRWIGSAKSAALSSSSSSSGEREQARTAGRVSCFEAWADPRAALVVMGGSASGAPDGGKTEGKGKAKGGKRRRKKSKSKRSIGGGASAASGLSMGRLCEDTVLLVLDNPWGEVAAVLANRQDAPCDVWASAAVPEWFRRPIATNADVGSDRQNGAQIDAGVPWGEWRLFAGGLELGMRKVAAEGEDTGESAAEGKSHDGDDDSEGEGEAGAGASSGLGQGQGAAPHARMSCGELSALAPAPVLAPSLTVTSGGSTIDATTLTTHPASENTTVFGAVRVSAAPSAPRAVAASAERLLHLGNHSAGARGFLEGLAPGVGGSAGGAVPPGAASGDDASVSDRDGESGSRAGTGWRDRVMGLLDRSRSRVADGAGGGSAGAAAGGGASGAAASAGGQGGTTLGQGPVLRARAGHPRLLCAFRLQPGAGTAGVGGASGTADAEKGAAAGSPPPPGMLAKGASGAGAWVGVEAGSGLGRWGARLYPSLLGFDLDVGAQSREQQVGGEDAVPSSSSSSPPLEPDEDPSQGDWRVQVRAVQGLQVLAARALNDEPDDDDDDEDVDDDDDDDDDDGEDDDEEEEEEDGEDESDVGDEEDAASGEGQDEEGDDDQEAEEGEDEEAAEARSASDDDEWSEGDGEQDESGLAVVPRHMRALRPNGPAGGMAAYPLRSVGYLACYCLSSFGTTEPLVLAACVQLLRAITCTDDPAEAEALAAQGAIDWGCHAVQVIQAADGVRRWEREKQGVRDATERRALEAGAGEEVAKGIAEGVTLGLTPASVLDSSLVGDAALVATNLLRFPGLQAAGAAGWRASAATVLAASAHLLNLCGRHVQQDPEWAGGDGDGEGEGSIELRLDHEGAEEVLPTAMRLLKYGVTIAEAEAEAGLGIAAEGGQGHGATGGGEDAAALAAARLGCVDGLCAAMREVQQEQGMVVDLLHQLCLLLAQPSVRGVAKRATAVDLGKIGLGEVAPFLLARGRGGGGRGGQAQGQQGEDGCWRYVECTRRVVAAMSEDGAAQHERLQTLGCNAIRNLACVEVEDADRDEVGEPGNNEGGGEGEQSREEEEEPPRLLRVTSAQMVAMAGGAAACEAAMERFPENTSIGEHGRCALFNLVLLSSTAQPRILGSLQGLSAWAAARARVGRDSRAITNASSGGAAAGAGGATDAHADAIASANKGGGEKSSEDKQNGLSLDQRLLQEALGQAEAAAAEQARREQPNRGRSSSMPVTPADLARRRRGQIIPVPRPPGAIDIPRRSLWPVDEDGVGDGGEDNGGVGQGESLAPETPFVKPTPRLASPSAAATAHAAGSSNAGHQRGSPMQGGARVLDEEMGGDAGGSIASSPSLKSAPSMAGDRLRAMMRDRGALPASPGDQQEQAGAAVGAGAGACGVGVVLQGQGQPQQKSVIARDEAQLIGAAGSEDASRGARDQVGVDKQAQGQERSNPLLGAHESSVQVGARVGDAAGGMDSQSDAAAGRREVHDTAAGAQSGGLDQDEAGAGCPWDRVALGTAALSLVLLILFVLAIARVI